MLQPEDNTLFIETLEDVRGFTYAYSANGLERYLRFSFGGREEALKRKAD
jgi:hypothetical protein